MIGAVKISLNEFSWSAIPGSLSFPRGNIEAWKIRLDETEILSTPVLSPDETARASRYHFERDRLHFSCCRSALRFLISAYLGVPAADIRFEYPSSGKPQLVTDQSPDPLYFNVSHSGDIGLIVFSSEFTLGADVERIRENVDTVALAERFFSIRERAGLRALPPELRVAGFYACWTRKEAYLKATGDGLSFPLADFSVSTHPDLDPQLEEIKGDIYTARQWSLADLPVAGCRAAVAFKCL